MRILLLAPAVAMAAAASIPSAHAEATASASFRETVSQVQARIAAGDLTGAMGYAGALTPSSPLEKYMAASLSMEIAAKRNDIVAQRKAIAEMIESGAAPEGQLGYLNRVAGFLSYQTGAIDNAVVYLTRARSLGEASPQTSLMLAEAYVRQRKLPEAAQVVNETIAAQKAAGQAVPATWYDRAASLARARKDWASLAEASAAKLSQGGMAGPDWRSGIMTYVEAANPEPEAKLDLLRLEAATGAMASERDYQAYATLAANQGYAAEGKAVVEAGLSSQKLGSGDPVAATLMRTLRSKAIVNLAALKPLPGKAASAASGARAAKAGDDLLANSQFAEAVPYYRAALEKGDVDRDRVTTRLGIALARSGDLGGAQIAFAQATGRWKDVAAYWSAWVNARNSSVPAPAVAATN
ncbi:MAG: hypothetical protein AB7U35_04875 [Sphingobium sp.]